MEQVKTGYVAITPYDEFVVQRTNSYIRKNTYILSKNISELDLKDAETSAFLLGASYNNTHKNKIDFLIKKVKIKTTLEVEN